MHCVLGSLYIPIISETQGVKMNSIPHNMEEKTTYWPLVLTNILLVVLLSLMTAGYNGYLLCLTNSNDNLENSMCNFYSNSLQQELPEQEA